MDPGGSEVLGHPHELEEAGRVLGITGVVCGKPAREEAVESKAELGSDWNVPGIQERK